jgi:hypothetical protein
MKKIYRLNIIAKLYLIDPPLNQALLSESKSTGSAIIIKNQQQFKKVSTMYARC